MDKQFLGCWTLVDWTMIMADVSGAGPFGRDAFGQLLYGADGRMSALLASQAWKACAPEDIHKHFFAYAGRARLDGNMVIHRLDTCSDPAQVGTDLVRFFHWHHGNLVLETAPVRDRQGREIISYLVWRQAGAG